jgi:coenzyme F420-reducing hydrogenase delta subunit
MDFMSAVFEPRIVGFLCDWCSRNTVNIDGADYQPFPPSIKIIGVTCTGRVDPLFLIRAYLHGADGVFVAGCQPGQCHYKMGNYQARRRMALLRNIFETLNLDADRLHIEWVLEAQARQLTKVATKFEEQIEQKGPNTIQNEIFI